MLQWPEDKATLQLVTYNEVITMQKGGEAIIWQECEFTQPQDGKCARSHKRGNRSAKAEQGITSLEFPHAVPKEAAYLFSLDRS